ncbi:MAG: Amuc_1102 family pilus-like protein [Spartobacteria bacterium]
MPPKIVLTIFLAALAGSAAAQNRGADFQLTKITRNLISAPEFNYSGAETYRINSRDRWLEVEVEFVAAPEFTDELTLKYFILINGKLLTGEVTHVNILPGKELRSVMYVPPRALAHIMGNRPLTANTVENVAVEVVQQGAVKDELSLARGRPQWFAGLPAVSGLALNKNETPFAPLYWDRYEQIKPAGR